MSKTLAEQLRQLQADTDREGSAVYDVGERSFYWAHRDEILRALERYQPGPLAADPEFSALVENLQRRAHCGQWDDVDWFAAGWHACLAHLKETGR